MTNNIPVLFKCSHCDHSEEAPAKCPVTGHEAGSGWTYVCPVCNANMVITKEQ